MAGNMGLIVKKSFPNATLVIDRFHVQKLALDALQEIRIKHRWQAIDLENDAIEHAKIKKTTHTPELLSNGDTLKQLLARSRYLLYKSNNNRLKTNQKEDLCFLKNILISKKNTNYAKTYLGYLIIQKIKQDQG